MSLRCAAYARYSSDLQSPLSIDDQLRICREYAKSRGFVFLEEHVYVDEALSSVGADRPQVKQILLLAHPACMSWSRAHIQHCKGSQGPTN